MRRRILTAVTMTAAAALLFSGCSTGEAAAPSASTSRPTEIRKILFDFPYTALPVYAALVSGVQARAKELGVTVDVTNDNSTLATQVTNLTTGLTGGYDAVVSFPMDEAAVSTVARQYIDSGTYWITYGGNLDPQDATLQFSFYDSGATLGKNAGAWIAKNAPDSSEVLVLASQTIYLGQQRTKGIEEGLRSVVPNVDIVASQEAVTPDQGLQVTNAVLAQHPDVNVVLAASGDAAQGAYQALLAAGRDPQDTSIYVGGLDGNLSLFQAMKNGEFVREIVTINPADISNAVVDVPVSLAAGTGKVENNVPVYEVRSDSPELQGYIDVLTPKP